MRQGTGPVAQHVRHMARATRTRARTHVTRVRCSRHTVADTMAIVLMQCNKQIDAGNGEWSNSIYARTRTLASFVTHYGA